MIGSIRLLILLFATLAMVSAMGWFGGSRNYEPEGCDGDWPEEFPQPPEGFDFKCRCPCKCRRKTTTVSIQSSSTSTSAAPTSTSTTTIPTSSSTPSSTSTNPPTTTPTTTTPPTTTRPTTTPSTTTRPTTTVVVTDPIIVTQPTPVPVEPEIESSPIPSQVILEGGHLVVADESEGKDIVEGTGTTFWIRSPTPPNAPDSVVKGGSGFTAGPPQFATVKIDAPHAPDTALAPDALPSGDLDFGFKTVGTPKPPRAVVDPDA
uniref:Secreted protein n=1 Tax=Caenorhabditis tropicalis TaxID=1561998 RepID=A0A1I7UHC0_9PELO